MSTQIKVPQQPDNGQVFSTLVTLNNLDNNLNEVAANYRGLFQNHSELVNHLSGLRDGIRAIKNQVLLNTRSAANEQLGCSH